MNSSPLCSATLQPLFPERKAEIQQVDKTLLRSGNASSLALSRVSSAEQNLRALRAPGKRRDFPKWLDVDLHNPFQGGVRDIFQRRASSECHCQVEFRENVLDHLANTLFPGNGKTVDVGTPETDR